MAADGDPYQDAKYRRTIDAARRDMMEHHITAHTVTINRVCDRYRIDRDTAIGLAAKGVDLDKAAAAAREKNGTEVLLA